MQSLRIILLCIAGAIVYGVIHDQVTARICVEYFTIGHEPIFNTTDPTLLGLGWGVIATWWVGLILGVVLALACRAGSWPKMRVVHVFRPLAITLMGVGVLACIAGLAAQMAAQAHAVWLMEPMASRVPPDRHVPFLIDLWTHTMSYAAGFTGGLGLAGYLLIRRAMAAHALRLRAAGA